MNPGLRFELRFGHRFTQASAQRLTQLDQRFLDTGDVPATRCRKLRCAATAAAHRGSSQDRGRSSIDPRTLSRGDDQCNPLGAGDTGKADGLDTGVISNRDR
jgi:hypothetical protein